MILLSKLFCGFVDPVMWFLGVSFNCRLMLEDKNLLL
jgi:hypothetical protein